MLDAKAAAISGAVVMGAVALFTCLWNLADPSYGVVFLDMLSSIWPGFKNDRSFVAAIMATAYAAVDGAIFTYVFVWIYNRLAAS
jgi:hypothetical protein